jgi:hypothetical protein
MYLKEQDQFFELEYVMYTSTHLQIQVIYYNTIFVLKNKGLPF